MHISTQTSLLKANKKRDAENQMVIKWKSLDLDERAGIKEKVGDENVKHVRVVVLSGEEDEGKKASIASDKCGNDHFL